MEITQYGPIGVTVHSLTEMVHNIEQEHASTQGQLLVELIVQ